MIRRYAGKAHEFVSKMKDVTEFLASIELNTDMKPVPYTVTYQDSCHLAHGQKIRTPPRVLLRSVPGLTLKEMPMSDLCCGSAGIYNVVENEMSMAHPGYEDAVRQHGQPRRDRHGKSWLHAAVARRRKASR